MNYQETLDYLFSQLPMYQRIGKAAYKANLDNTLALDRHFDHPHRSFRTIHVAGTNGKGSVSHMLAAVLQAAGYKTGLYTSPHLRDFRERIRANGLMVPEEYVVDFVSANKAVFERVKPSFFEMTVSMAFQYFHEEQIDVAVVETGMGGRLDSTNIITPVLSIITNISADHTEFLGNTVEQIAREKAGIIKPGIPLLVGETQEKTREVFLHAAWECNSPISFAEEIYSLEYSIHEPCAGQKFRIRRKGTVVYENLVCDLLGAYQKKNILTVLAAVDLLKENFSLDRNHIYQGLAGVSQSTGLLGRWQIMQKSPLIIADTAHNLEGLRAVMEQIRATPHQNLHMVLGFVNDKVITDILKLMPRKASYYFTKASIPRAMDEKELSRQAARSGLKGTSHATVAEALAAAKGKAGPNDLIFIGGSTFVVAEVV